MEYPGTALGLLPQEEWLLHAAEQYLAYETTYVYIQSILTWLLGKAMLTGTAATHQDNAAASSSTPRCESPELRSAVHRDYFQVSDPSGETPQQDHKHAYE